MPLSPLMNEYCTRDQSLVGFFIGTPIVLFIIEGDLLEVGGLVAGILAIIVILVFITAFVSFLIMVISWFYYALGKKDGIGDSGKELSAVQRLTIILFGVLASSLIIY